MYVREYDDSCIRVETYDHVMVCTGPFRKPKIPAIKGMKLFKGKVMHMHQYRTRETFIGKKVVVVGMYRKNVQKLGFNPSVYQNAIFCSAWGLLTCACNMLLKSLFTQYFYRLPQDQ